jgi:hypothetical protein
MANMGEIKQPQYKVYMESCKEYLDEGIIHEHYVKYLHSQNMKKDKKVYVSKKGHKIKCVHEDGCYPIIGNLVQDFNPQLVLELGFSWGGMTKVFEDYTKADIHAYNKRCGRMPSIRLFDNKRVHFHWADILEIPLERLISFCKDKRKKLLYCDNGNKIKEVYMYGQHLNVGDMIGAHDYPKEIYHDYNFLFGKTKNRNTREDVDNMNSVLADFEPYKHDLFLEKAFSDRFWIKVR